MLRTQKVSAAEEREKAGDTRGEADAHLATLDS